MPDFSWINDQQFVKQLITVLFSRIGAKPTTTAIALELQSVAHDPAAIDELVGRQEAAPFFTAIQDLVGAADRYNVRTEIFGFDRSKLDRAISARGAGLPVDGAAEVAEEPANPGAQRLRNAATYADIEPVKATKDEVRAMTDIVKSLPKPMIKRIFGTANPLVLGTLVRFALKAFRFSNAGS